MRAGVRRGAGTRTPAEHQEIAQRVAAEPVGAVEPARDLAGGEEPGHRRGLALGVDLHAAHHVVRGREHLHRLARDVDVGELEELLVHARQLLPDVLGLAARGDVEERAAVRAAAPFPHLLRDGARDDVPGEQLRRASCLGLAAGDDVGHPAVGLLLGVGEVAAEHLGDVAEHEALAAGVLEDAAFPAHALGHQDAADAEWPHHSGRVELDELHADQVGAGVVGQRMAVAGVLPRVAVDLVGAADPAGREHDGLRAEQQEAAALAAIGERAADPAVVGQEPRDGAFHEDVDALRLHRPVLQGPDHLEARAIADVGEPRVLMATEVPLENPAVGGAVEERAPCLELADPGRRFLGQELRHPPVVEKLPAPHRVAEMHPPSRLSVVASAAATPPSAITVWAFPSSDLQTTATETPWSTASIAARRPAPPAPTTSTS